MTSGKDAAWYGEFRLPDGTVILRNVSIVDVPVSAMRAGVPVAARDVGYISDSFPPDSGDVFPRHDPAAWHLPANLAVMGGWCYAWVLVLLIRGVARRLRRSGHRGSSDASP
ncbi:MAG: hypothetical protein ACRDN0_29505 [Trebonia sp.]